MVTVGHSLADYTLKEPPMPKATTTTATTTRSLNVRQVRILAFLAKRKTGRATRQQLAVAATKRKNGTMDGSYLGCLDPNQRQAAEEKSGYPSLLTLKYVKIVKVPVPDGEGFENWYEITKAGHKALEG